MSGLKPGLLDREVVLQTGVKSQDPDTGEELIDWETTEATLWAQWLPAGTTEAYRAQQRLGSYVDGVFRIYDRDPRPTPDASRIVFDGRTFEILTAVDVQERHRILLLNCRELI